MPPYAEDENRMESAQIPDGGQAPQPSVSYRKEARKAFSRAGFALFAMFAIGQALQGTVAFALQRWWPTFQTDSPIVFWLALFGPLYLVAMPIALLIFRKIPRAQIAEEPEKLPFGRWLSLLPIALFLMYTGNLIGTGMTMLLSKVFPGASLDAGDINPIMDLVNGTGLLPRILVVCFLGPLVEEFIFRKQLIDRTRVYGEELSVVFSAVMFGLFHGNLQQGVYAALFGLLLGYVYLKTRNLLYSWSIHVCVNFVGGVIAPAMVFDNMGEDLETIENLGPVVAFGACVIVLFILGFILFLRQWRYVRFAPAEKELAPRERGVSWQNPGVILFALLGIGSIVAVFAIGLMR